MAQLRALAVTAPSLIAQAYTTLATDLILLLNVTAGVSAATITLLAAATAGEGAVQVVQKADNGTQSVIGCANNGASLVRVQVGSTTGMVTNQRITINQVTGTIEANGTWKITVIDGTHFDLQGSAFVTTYVSGGTVSGGRVTVTDGVSDLAWLSAQLDCAMFIVEGGAWVGYAVSIQPLAEAYRISDTWTKPPLLQYCDIEAYGPGGSSGSGARRATGGIRTGGGGGAPGSRVLKTFPASQLSGTETIVIGAPGAIGAAVTVDTTNGNAAIAGSDTTIATTKLVAKAGINGTAGSAVATGGGAAAGNSAWAIGFSLSSGQAPSSTANLVQQVSGQIGAGSGGGSADASNVQRLPGAGQDGSIASVIATGGVAGTAGNPGGAGLSITDWLLQQGGGAGGGGFFVAATAGTAGGAGGFPGGGAGGGAASDNGNNSGAGALGGGGQMRFISHF